MEQLDMIFFGLSLGLKVFTIYFAVVALFLLKKRVRPRRAKPQTRFAVVVAARNEEAVIGGLVQSVLAQDYPPELRDVYVVPNNCTDGTEAAALSAGAKIIRCVGPVSGKGDALHQAFEKLLHQDYDAFVVFDADNTLAPDYLARMNDALLAGAKVCKSRTKASNPRASGVAGCYGLYNACFDLIWNRPRSACGLSAKLIGTGFAVHRSVLEDLGGWNTSTIAEDAEFASQLARAGYQVAWVPEAVNYDEEPTSFRVSLHQRKRWCSGLMQVARRTLPALWQGESPAPLRRWDMTMFLAAPFSQAVSAILLLLGVLTSFAQGDTLGLLVMAGSFALYLAGGMALGAALCLIGGYGLRGMGRTILIFPVFMASWLPLQVISLFKDTKKWKPIAHGGVCPQRIGIV